MTPEIISLLTQLPIVAIFIWYSERMNRQFQAFLKEQRDADRKILADMLEELKCLELKAEAHDARMTIAFDKAVARASRKPRQS